jgi:hypothetical protein
MLLRYVSGLFFGCQKHLLHFTNAPSLVTMARPVVKIFGQCYPRRSSGYISQCHVPSKYLMD